MRTASANRERRIVSLQAQLLRCRDDLARLEHARSAAFEVASGATNGAALGSEGEEERTILHARETELLRRIDAAKRDAANGSCAGAAPSSSARARVAPADELELLSA